MKIALVSGWDRGLAGLAALTWPNKVEYCERHGYAALRDMTDVGRHPVWIRIAAAREALARYDWVFMLDVDTLIMDMTTKLESFLDTTADLVTSYDVNGLNCGSTFMRNTDWARRFLNKLWDAGPRYQHHPSQEQSALAHLLYQEPQHKWQCVPQRRFNSFLYGEYPGLHYPEGEYQAGDFILHLPALRNARRLEIFKEYLPLVKR